ncbi:acetyl-CoA carboxylase biotin carboxylase subunit family protein [Kitasatospora sp. NPDC058965]|uniref:ATP-grasp domain-containing protein n=1 Tax=Kitasatospora sp. NPDC058965 TaxID=3346682 RepID=UPI0036A599CA
MTEVLLLNSDKPAVLRALARRPWLNVRVLARPGYRDRYPAHHRFEPVADLTDLTAVRATALRLDRERAVDRVLAATEKAILPAGLIRSQLGLPGGGFDQAMWASHKYAMKHRLRSRGLPVTDFAQVSTVDRIPAAAERLGWPVVVKPVFGAGAAHTHRVDSAADLAARRAELALLDTLPVPLQVERFVAVEEEYHCDAVVRAGTVRFAAVSRYFFPLLSIDRSLRGSCTLAADEPVVAAAEELLGAVVAALDLADGVVHLELFGTGRGLLVGEVTVRPGGAAIPRLLELAHGVDLWEEFAAAGLGEPERPVAGRRRPGVVGYVWLPAALGPAAAALPGVLELRPEETGGRDRLAVHFAAPDRAGADALRARLHGLRAGERR